MLRLEVKPSTRDLNQRVFADKVNVFKKKPGGYQQNVDPHLTENTSWVLWCSQLKEGWVHLLAPMMHFPEHLTPKTTFYSHVIGEEPDE